MGVEKLLHYSRKIILIVFCGVVTLLGLSIMNVNQSQSLITSTPLAIAHEPKNKTVESPAASGISTVNSNGVRTTLEFDPFCESDRIERFDFFYEWHHWFVFYANRR